MGNAKAVKADLSGIKRLQELIEKGMPKIRVGILKRKDERDVEKSGAAGNKAKKTKKEIGNAEIGLYHEFGSLSGKLPARSFLKEPLEVNFEKDLAKEKALTGVKFKEALKGGKGGVRKFAKQIGIAAEKTVRNAFDTSFDGRWEPLKNRAGKPLIDTGQLRQSIISEVGK
jgi:phage gpG-like protein